MPVYHILAQKVVIYKSNNNESGLTGKRRFIFFIFFFLFNLTLRVPETALCIWKYRVCELRYPLLDTYIVRYYNI